MEISCTLLWDFWNQIVVQIKPIKFQFICCHFQQYFPLLFNWIYIGIYKLQNCTFPRLMKILNIGDSINCERSEQPERLREAFTGVQGAAPRRGLLSSLSPPCFLSLCIWLASTKPIPRIFVWGGCKFFKSGSLPDFLNVGIFAKILEFFVCLFVCFLLFFASEGVNLTKEDPFLNFKLFFVQKYIKFPIFQTCFARKQQFGDFLVD